MVAPDVPDVVEQVDGKLTGYVLNLRRLCVVFQGFYILTETGRQMPRL